MPPRTTSNINEIVREGGGQETFSLAPDGRQAQSSGEQQPADIKKLEQVFWGANSHDSYNAQVARVRIPSGLCIEAWRRHLMD